MGRARLRKRRIVAATVIAPTLAACASDLPHAAPAASSAPSVAPVPKVERRGVSPKPLVSVKPHPRATPRIGTALNIRHLRTTVYCYGSMTYTGHHVFHGLAAVKASSGIPFGAVLHVGGRRYVVDDREPSYGVSDVDLYWGDEPNCEHLADVYGIQRRDVEIERAA
jgi:hypothetical protein